MICLTSSVEENILPMCTAAAVQCARRVCFLLKSWCPSEQQRRPFLQCVAMNELRSTHGYNYVEDCDDDTHDMCLTDSPLVWLLVPRWRARWDAWSFQDIYLNLFHPASSKQILLFIVSQLMKLAMSNKGPTSFYWRQL